MLRTPVLLALAAAVIHQAAIAQAVDSSPRVAAFRYAMENGMTVPRDSVVIAHDPNIGYYTAPYVSRAEMTVFAAEAREMARIAGAGASDAPARAVLQCPTYDCATSKRLTVVVVSVPSRDPPANADGLVPVYVYGPGARGNERSRQMGMVLLARDGAGWRGTGFLFYPAQVTPARVTPRVAVPEGRPVPHRAATDAEQRELEVHAAGWLAASGELSGSRADYALETRVYSLGWGLQPSRDNVFSATRLRGNDDAHLSRIASVMGATILDERVSCLVFRPSACRPGPYRAAIAFSRAVIRGDTAQIAIFRTARDTVRGAASPAVVITGWSLLLMPGAGDTKVISYSTHSAITP